MVRQSRRIRIFRSFFSVARIRSKDTRSAHLPNGNRPLPKRRSRRKAWGRDEAEPASFDYRSYQYKLPEFTTGCAS